MADVSEKEALAIALLLQQHQIRAMNALQHAGGSFTPCWRIMGITDDMAETLVGLGLAERGTVDTSPLNPEVGYRLSRLGWRVLDLREKERAARWAPVPGLPKSDWS